MSKLDPLTKSLRLAQGLSPGVKIRLIRTHIRPPYFEVERGQIGTVASVNLDIPLVAVEFDQPVVTGQPSRSWTQPTNRAVAQRTVVWQGRDFEKLADEVEILSDADQRFALLEMNPGSKRHLRRNATYADQVSVLLDAVEEGRGDQIVPLFEEYFGGPPSAPRLYALAVAALAHNRPDQARVLFKDGRSMDRWAILPLELQRFVPFERQVVKEELAHSLGVKKSTLKCRLRWEGVFACWDPEEPDNVDRPFEELNHLYNVYQNRGAVRQAAADRVWRNRIQALIAGGQPFNKAVVQREVKQIVETGSLGEMLGHFGGDRPDQERVLPSGFFVFEEGRPR